MIQRLLYTAKESFQFILWIYSSLQPVARRKLGFPPPLFFSVCGNPHVSGVVLGRRHLFRVPLECLVHERLDLDGSKQPRAPEGVIDDRDRLGVVAGLPSDLFLALCLRGRGGGGGDQGGGVSDSTI